MGRIESICVGNTKGEKKAPIDCARLITDHGIDGDAHAGNTHRQISLLAKDDIENAKHDLPEIGPGDFAENLAVSGIDLGTLGPGSEIGLGKEALIRISQLGKECHNPCAIGKITGDCIMPKAGIFARVVKDGKIAVGDEATVINTVPRETLQAVVLTISDRCSRNETADTAGPAISILLDKELDCNVYTSEIIPDDHDKIAERLIHYSGGHSIDLIVTVGGTGFSPRDITPEAVSSVVDRPTPGLDEAMRAASLSKTPNAILSRSSSGIRKSTLILSVPGSERSAIENLASILPALDHGLRKLRGDQSDCGR